MTVQNGIINSFDGFGFEHQEESVWRSSTTEIGFSTDTYGDADGVDIDVSNLENSTIRIEGTIDGYVKVGNPLDGNPFKHCPEFSWEVSGKELLESNGRLRKELGGTDLFLAVERISDTPMPRDVSGTLDIDPNNGPHGFRPVFVLGRQVDDAKCWTSAMFIDFGN